VLRPEVAHARSRCFLANRLEDGLGLPSARRAIIARKTRQCRRHRVHCLPRQQGRAGNPLPHRRQLKLAAACAAIGLQ
jgi:hypothetical protein